MLPRLDSASSCEGAYVFSALAAESIQNGPFSGAAAEKDIASEAQNAPAPGGPGASQTVCVPVLLKNAVHPGSASRKISKSFLFQKCSICFWLWNGTHCGSARKPIVLTRLAHAKNKRLRNRAPFQRNLIIVVSDFPNLFSRIERTRPPFGRIGIRLPSPVSGPIPDLKKAGLSGRISSHLYIRLIVQYT